MARNEMEKTNEGGLNRRSFIALLWIGLGIAALAEIIWLVLSFLRPRKQKTTIGDYGNVISAGSVDSFTAGTVTAFPRGRFYLACLNDGGFLAISQQCTHLGCTVPWNEKDMKFECPCHASAFDITGSVVKAPAPRSLDIYRIVIENDVVMVDTGTRIKRSGFRKSQVVYPRKNPD
jgi:Rieske Fe-S protein